MGRGLILNTAYADPTTADNKRERAVLGVKTALVKTQHSAVIKCFRCDLGGEYTFNKFCELLEIVIAPPNKKLADFNVDVPKESSISTVLCGNVNQKQIGPSSSEDNKRRIRHFKLYRAALKGDWSTAERIYEEDKDYIAAKLSKERDTALHIAAAARHAGFVKKLLEQMQMEDLTIKNNVGNTAFFLAAASGEVDIAEAMMEKHGDLVMIRGKDDMLPLHKAALMGNEEMVEYLYQATGYKLLDHDNDLIELTFIKPLDTNY